MYCDNNYKSSPTGLNVVYGGFINSLFTTRQ